MRTYDEEEATRLNAQPWQIELLALNPDYSFWGPHEDYMIVKGDGWNSPQFFDSWTAFGPWNLDELNECVNFHFSVDRASEECKTCGGDGTHPDGQWISESWYRHSSPFKRQSFSAMQAEALMNSFGSKSNHIHGFGNYPDAATLEKYGPAFREFCEQMRERGHWSDDITQDEVQALVDAGRLMDFTHTFTPGKGWKKNDPTTVPTAEEVNAWQRGGGLGHDSINRWVAVKRRCERLGVPYQCPTCDGHGSVFTAPDAHVTLTLWWLHPRKGCSRGIEVKNIQRDELPAVVDFLHEARKRNDSRFAKLPPATGTPT